MIRPDTNVTPSQPEVDVNVDRRVAAQLGLSTGDIATIISTATTGTIASYWQTNGTQYPILVQYPPSQRRTLGVARARCRSMPNPAQTGGRAASVGGAAVNAPSSQSLTTVPLSGVATITIGQGPSQISRQNKQRRIDITAPIVGAALGDVVAEAQQVMAGYALPSGYRWQFGPAITQNNDTFSALTLVVILAIALIYMLLASQFESFLDPLVIMMSVPFALIGIVGVALAHPPRVRPDRVHRLADAGRHRGEERDPGGRVHQAAAPRRGPGPARGADAGRPDAPAADPHDDPGDAGRHAADRDRHRGRLARRRRRSARSSSAA